MFDVSVSPCLYPTYSGPNSLIEITGYMPLQKLLMILNPGALSTFPVNKYVGVIFSTIVMNLHGIDLLMVFSGVHSRINLPAIALEFFPFSKTV